MVENQLSSSFNKGQDDWFVQFYKGTMKTINLLLDCIMIVSAIIILVHNVINIDD